jgi:hypothetical protein
MAFIRSPTVSLPVEAYVVVLPPALTLIEAPAGMPSVASGVLVLNGAVPTAVAGEADEPELVDEDEPDDEDAVDVEFPDSTFCIAAVNSELTRLSAVPLAMLAKPLARLTSALPIALINESLAATLAD